MNDNCLTLVVTKVMSATYYNKFSQRLGQLHWLLSMLKK